MESLLEIDILWIENKIEILAHYHQFQCFTTFNFDIGVGSEMSQKGPFLMCMSHDALTHITLLLG